MAFIGWCNDATDNFKDFSLQLNSKQDRQESEGKVYVGNGKIKPTSASMHTSQPTQSANTPKTSEYDWDSPF